MIEIIRDWCEGIIIAIIISLIIELLVPEGNNKKYVKVIIGIYIVFVVINPLLKFLDYDFNFYEIFDIQTQETYSKMDNNIKDIYIVGIEENIKTEIEELGYIVNNVEVKVDSNYENIEKIVLEIAGQSIENTVIEPVIIGDNKNENNNYEDIIKLLNENYFVNTDQIIFN